VHGFLDIGALAGVVFFRVHDAIAYRAVEKQRLQIELAVNGLSFERDHESLETEAKVVCDGGQYAVFEREDVNRSFGSAHDSMLAPSSISRKHFP
jgi:hypothetical protein